MKTEKESQISEEIIFKQNYPGFREFLMDCQDSIYRRILVIHEELNQSGQKEKRLIIMARIDGFIYGFERDISRDNRSVLKEVISKYFELIEDYETCAKIVKICHPDKG